MSKKLISVLATFLVLTLCMSVSVFAERAAVAEVSGQKDDGSRLSEEAGSNEFENIIDGDPLTRWGSINCTDNGDHVAIILELTRECLKSKSCTKNNNVI